MTRRHAVLLGTQAAGHPHLLEVHAPYRLDGPGLDVRIEVPGPGHLSCSLLVPGSGEAWNGGPWTVDRSVGLSLDLETGAVRIDGAPVGTLTGLPKALRRFELAFHLTQASGARWHRRTGHYVARRDAAIDERYYQGDDYVDYEAQSHGSTDLVLDLLASFDCQGPVLEVGCATGATLDALRTRGLDAVGIDISDWAIERAAARVVHDRVAVLDVERQDLPERIAARGPFGCLVMASVFEHFSDPFAVLERLGRHVRPGGSLIVTTTNADSLTHRLFGEHWEGFFDWTHHGIETVTPASMRARLPGIGWRIAHLRTWHVWDGNADPTHATLREWHDADARFRQLLSERELGDFLACVAKRVG